MSDREGSVKKLENATSVPCDYQIYKLIAVCVRTADENAADYNYVVREQFQ